MITAIFVIVEVFILLKNSLYYYYIIIKEIWRHLYKTLHAFLNLYDSKFCLQGESFYI